MSGLHYRSAYRSTALAALTADPRFADFTAPKVWPGATDADSLPIIGVLTPQERTRIETLSSTERTTLLQVAIRRAGGDDVEELLDIDSLHVEAILMATLTAGNQWCFPRETSLVSNTDGIRNVGTLVMGFEITSMRPLASLPPAP